MSEGNFNLHDAFLSGLLQVSPSVRKYKRITEIVEMQLQLVTHCKGALRRFRVTELFSNEEIGYLEQVYNHLLQSSMRNLEDLATVITAGTLRMSDEERLQLIDNIHEEMSEKLAFARYFNDDNAKVLLGRVRETKDVKVLEKLSIDR